MADVPSLIERVHFFIEHIFPPSLGRPYTSDEIAAGMTSQGLITPPERFEEILQDSGAPLSAQEAEAFMHFLGVDSRAMFPRNAATWDQHRTIIEITHSQMINDSMVVYRRRAPRSN